MKPPSNSNCRNTNPYYFISGITITLLGIILLLVIPWILELIVDSVLVLKPNNFIDSVWRKIPDVHLDCYVYNWTNPEDFHNISIKPRFEEVGPFKLDQTIEKVDVVWNMNNTVTYGQHRHISIKDDNITNINMFREITVLNVFGVFAAHLVRNEHFLLKKLVSTYIATSVPDMHMTMVPHKWYFDGIKNIAFDVGKYFPFIHPELPRYDSLNVQSMLDDYIGLEGIMNMGNGVNGDFAMHNFNFNKALPYFNGSCAKVRGSAGEIYPRNLPQKYIGVSVPILCRYVELEFEEEVVVNGILGYKYVVSTAVLDNGTLIPGNECYCAGKCIPSGVFNISPCHYGFPMIASLPHFYGADPVYLNSVDGLHPRKDKHEAYIIIEPITGILLKSRGRIQVNIRISSIEDISLLENIREMIFPYTWMEQRSALPDNLMLLLRIYLLFPTVLTGIASVFIILGLILICIPFKPKLLLWWKNLEGKNQGIRSAHEQIPLRCTDSTVKTDIYS